MGDKCPLSFTTMEFKDLKIGDSVYILENVGTFRKVTSFNIGTIVNISQPYDEVNNSNPYLNQLLKNKLIDITVTCEGTQKKLTVGANKSNVTDNSIGLTISTSNEELINQIKQQCKEWEGKIAQIENYQRELDKCKQVLNQLKGDETVEYDTNGTIKVN